MATRAPRSSFRTPQAKRYDAIIVGGGPAGLSAALVLARCGRRVLVVDAGRGRNYAARRMYNYLSRDGINPRRLRELGRAEIASYGVEFRRDIVTAARCVPGGFTVSLEEGGRRTSRTLLLATGVADELPEIANVREFYGLGVHHCPYCDGWEYRGRALAAYGRDKAGLGLALNLLTWSNDVTIVSNGERPPPHVVRKAKLLGIKVRKEPIVRLESTRGRTGASPRDPLGRIVFQAGPPLEVGAMFFNTEKVQRSSLPVRLGCRVNAEGGVIHDKRQRRGVGGLYLAGDASFDVQFVVVAAAEGAKAAVAMNRDMQEVDRARERRNG